MDVGRSGQRSHKIQSRRAERESPSEREREREGEDEGIAQNKQRASEQTKRNETYEATERRRRQTKQASCGSRVWPALSAAVACSHAICVCASECVFVCEAGKRRRRQKCKQTETKRK